MSNLFRRGAVWYGRTSKDGKELVRSFRTRNRQVAESAFRRWLRDVDAEFLGLKGPLTFWELAEMFARDHLPTVGKRTADLYQQQVRTLNRFFDGKRVDEIDIQAMRAFTIARLREDRVSVKTVRNDLSALSSMFSAGIRAGMVTGNPVHAFVRSESRYLLKGGKQRDRYLSHDEERLVLAALAQRAPRLRDAAAFAIDTGLRLAEQWALEWRDFRPEQGQHGDVVVRHGKGDKKRVVPLWPRARQILDHMPRHPTDPHIFLGVDGAAHGGRQATKALRAVLDQLRLPPATWHDLRRTCGCRLLQDRQFTLDEVAKWLGHERSEVTSIYSFLEYHHLHAAVARSGPPVEGSGAEIVPLRRGGAR